MPGVKEHVTRECNTLGGKFKTLNAKPAMQQIFGRDISAGISGTLVLGEESPNCIAWECVVNAWRYHEWQTNMEHQSLPSVSGWTFKRAYYGDKVDC